MLFGWFDNGGGPGLGCPTSMQYGYSDGLRQDFTHGSLYWKSGMDHAKRVTWSDATHKIWAGYAVKGSSIDYISGSWSVPKMSCSQTSIGGNAVFWVGIDGYVNEDYLIQAGVRAICASPTASATYKIWWETNPTVPATNVASVTVGDKIQTTIIYDKTTSAYSMKITVNGTVRSITTDKLSGEPLTSAECVAESPILEHVGVSPLADFGTFQMADCTVATASQPNAISIIDGPQHGLAVYRLDLVRNGVLHATAGLPLNGTLPVTWKAP
jgi:hypothetical protein